MSDTTASAATKADALLQEMETHVGQAESAAQAARGVAEELKTLIAEQATNAASGSGEALAQAAGGAASAATGGAIDPFVFQFAIFVMAIFVGYYVVWSVTPALHTPLMAVTNAISSVIVVGALLAVGIQLAGTAATTFGFIALVLASVNIFGGFLVTQRMLAMYKKKER